MCCFCLDRNATWISIDPRTTISTFTLVTVTTTSASRRPSASSNHASSTVKHTQIPDTDFRTSKLYSDRQLLAFSSVARQRSEFIDVATGWRRRRRRFWATWIGADFCLWLWVYCIGSEGSPPVASRTKPLVGGQGTKARFPLPELTGRQHGPSTRLVETRACQQGPCWRVMEPVTGKNSGR